MKKISKADRQKIKEFYSVGEGNRKVRTTRDGEVHYYGSRSDTDRQHDFWHFGGHVDEVLRQAKVAIGGYV